MLIYVRLGHDKIIIKIRIGIFDGVPLAQWVKRWPTDPAVPSSSPAQGEIGSTINGVPFHTTFHYPFIALI